MSSQDIPDSSQLNLNGSFEDQMDQLLAQIRLTRQEVEDLSRLLDDLESVLCTEWPGCKALPFGSIVTGLGIRTSDVDCYVSLPQWVNKSDKDVVFIAKRILMRNPRIFSQTFAISGAKVPIVKFFHNPTGKQCDVNFKSPSGVRNSQLVAYLLHLDPRARPLAIAVKYWSKVHNLTGTNLLPNYALTLLVIFYLQQKDILPSVFQLQKFCDSEIVENWNTAFQRDNNHRTDNNESLCSLMGDFFDYYSAFNFEENIISPYLGCPIKRDLFKRIDTVPREFQMYKENLRKQACRPIKLDTMLCVQDPFEHCRNCAIAVFPKLASHLQSQFENAAGLFYEDRNNYLRSILTRVPNPHIASNIRNNINKAPKINRNLQNQGKVVKTTQHVQKTRKYIHNLYTKYVKNKKWDGRLT